ncbi:MAG: hypothetical protein ACRD19_14740 [Terriglobia bacterium]
MNNTHESGDPSAVYGADNGLNRGEQPEAPIETPEEQPEAVPDRQPGDVIVDVVGALDRVDQEILDAQKASNKRAGRLHGLRESMGMPPAESTPFSEFLLDQIQRLERRKAELIQRKEDWIKRHGRDALPDWLRIDDDSGSREVKAGWRDEEEGATQGSIEEGKEKELERRKRWLRQWEEDNIRHFEESIRADWKTSDAVNLELTLRLMKLRVPKAIERKAKDFVDGQADQPPFSAVWLRWQASSLLDKALGKPNHIEALEIVFDDEAAEIANEDDLKSSAVMAA